MIYSSSQQMNGDMRANALYLRIVCLFLPWKSQFCPMHMESKCDLTHDGETG